MVRITPPEATVEQVRAATQVAGRGLPAATAGTRWAPTSCSLSPARGATGSRMARWRVPLRWYAAATAPLAAGLVALGELWVTGRPLPSLDQLGFMPGLPAVGWLAVLVLALLVNGCGEETGWRASHGRGCASGPPWPTPWNSTSTTPPART